MKVKSEVAQSCPTLSDPMDRSLPGSSIHRIFQARVLEWGARPKSNPLRLYSRSDKQIQGIRSDRVPEELWMEDCHIVQEAVIKTIPKKKKGKKAKGLSEEALQIDVKRREAKGKREKERHTNLNAVPKNSKER